MSTELKDEEPGDVEKPPRRWGWFLSGFIICLVVLAFVLSAKIATTPTLTDVQKAALAVIDKKIYENNQRLCATVSKLSKFGATPNEMAKMTTGANCNFTESGDLRK